MKIDLEPTWMDVLNMVKSGALKAKDSDLEKACAIADIVRQAQKDGKKSVSFVFGEDRVSFSYDEVDSESDEPIQTEAYQDIDPNSTYGSFPDDDIVMSQLGYRADDNADKWLDNDLIEDTLWCGDCSADVVPDRMGNCPDCGAWLDRDLIEDNDYLEEDDE